MIIPHFETPDDNDWSQDYERYEKTKRMNEEIYTDSTPMPFGKHDGVTVSICGRYPLK